MRGGGTLFFINIPQIWLCFRLKVLKLGGVNPISLNLFPYTSLGNLQEYIPLLYVQNAYFNAYIYVQSLLKFRLFLFLIFFYKLA